MNPTIFAAQTDQILWSLTKVRSMHTTLTFAEAADVLLNIAYQPDFLHKYERTKSENTLSQWDSGRNSPRWAMRRALVGLFVDWWLLLTHPERAVFTSHFVMSIKGETLVAVLGLLPAGMDKSITAGWICAATENAARYQKWKEKR